MFSGSQWDTSGEGWPRWVGASCLGGSQVWGQSPGHGSHSESPGGGGAVLVVTQIPSLHPGLNESEFSQDPQICNLEVFPFPHFWFWVLGISGFVFLLCDYSCSRGEMGRLRQLRKDRARGTIISVSGSSLRTKDRFRPRKRRTEGTGAWALIWSYDLQQVSKVCWASVSSAV